MMDHVLLSAVLAPAPSKSVILAVTYEARTDRYLAYGAGELIQLREKLALCDHVTGWDLYARIYPALYGAREEDFRLLPAHRSLCGKTTDLMAKAAASMGREPYAAEFRKVWTLRSVCHATIDRVPADSGDDAAHNLMSGQWPSGLSYALDVMALVKELAWFVTKYGYLVGPSGQRVNVRGLGTWSPYSTADPVQIMEAEAGRGVPSTQAPASLMEMLARADELSGKAAEVLSK